MLKELLEKYDLKLAVAESLTGGKLSAKICNEEGISKYYLGSITAYSNKIKNKVLSVDMEFLDKFGPYNLTTTKCMCDGIMDLMTADITLAVSGVAGPGPDLGVEQGTYYITIKIKGKNNYRYFNKEFKSDCKTRGGVRAEAMTNSYRYLIEVLSNYDKY